MAVKLHTCGVTWLKIDGHACWRVEKALRDRGVPFLREPALTHRAQDHELWMAFFSDSEGNTAALMARKPLAV